MADKILIFQDVKARFSTLVADLEKLELEFHSYTELSDLPKMVTALTPKVVLLPSMETTDGWKAIAEGPLPRPFILALNPNEGEAEKGRAGYDRILKEPVSEVDLLEALLELIRSDGTPMEAEPPEETKRIATRVDFAGPVAYIYKGHQKHGWGVNASRSGLLLQTEEEIPTGSVLLIRFDGANAKTFDLGASSVRCERIDVPDREFTHAVGVRFLRLRESERDRLDLLMEERGLEAAQQLNPAYLKDLIERGEEILIEAFKKEINPTGLAIYLKEVGPFEREAFATEGEVQTIVRRLVALRVECYAFRLFLPAIKADRARYVAAMMPLLEDLIEHADVTEGNVENWVKDISHQGEVKNRQEMNESSNRLYQAKAKLLFAVDELLGPLKLGPDGEVVRKISERVRAIQQLRTPMKVTPRPVRKPAPPPKKASTRPPLNIPWTRVSVLIALITLVGWSVFLKKPTADIQHIKAPFKLMGTSLRENVLVVQVEWGLWRNLPKRTRDELMLNMERVLRESRLLEGRVVDEKDQPLAFLQGVETPLGREFNKKYVQR